MRLLIYVEPTSYLLPLWREIKAQTSVETRLIFLEENLTQRWDLDFQDDSRVEVLRGGRAAKLVRVLQLIWQDDLELVNLAGWGHPLLMVAFVFAGMRCIPVTVESDTQFEPTRVAWRRALKGLILPVLFRIPRLFFPAGTRQAAYFVHYRVRQEKIRLAQMTVDVISIMAQVDRYRHETSRATLNDRPVVFLYVGRLEIYKGVRDLLDAFVNLRQGGDSGQLIIVGDGALRGLVESVVRVHPSIEYLGRLTGEALFRVYSDADVFVLPSRVESWGLVVNEAMAASLPVIATDRVGCVDDLVHDGETGYVVPSASPSYLADAMRVFIHQPEIAMAMGQASRKLISTWTIEDEAKILVTAWDELK